MCGNGVYTTTTKPGSDCGTWVEHVREEHTRQKESFVLPCFTFLMSASAAENESEELINNFHMYESRHV